MARLEVLHGPRDGVANHAGVEHPADRPEHGLVEDVLREAQIVGADFGAAVMVPDAEVVRLPAAHPALQADQRPVAPGAHRDAGEQVGRAQVGPGGMAEEFAPVERRYMARVLARRLSTSLVTASGTRRSSGASILIHSLSGRLRLVFVPPL